MAMSRIATPGKKFIRNELLFYRIFRFWQNVFNAIDNRGANWHFYVLVINYMLEFIAK